MDKTKGTSAGTHKSEYLRREDENSELIVSSFGYAIGAGDEGLTVKKNGKKVSVPYAANIKHIVILSEGVSISSDAVHYCVKHNIPIDFFDRRLNYLASLLSPQFVLNTLWLPQSRLQVGQRVELARKILTGKMKNQLNLIKYFHKYHHAVTDFSERFGEIVRGLNQLIDRAKAFTLDDDERYQKGLMSIESKAAQLYWDYVRLLIEDDDVGFKARHKRGASDLVNAMLNYGYSMLYPRVWQGLMRARLNPYDGVIHYQAGNPNLVFDVIELFRCQAVDRIVIALVQKGEPLRIERGYLDDATRNLLAGKVVERLNRRERYRGREMRFLDIISKQAKEIAAFVETGQTYRPYIAKW